MPYENFEGDLIRPVEESVKIEKPLINTIVRTFKKAVASGKRLFSQNDYSKSNAFLDPFEFRYLDRIFDPRTSTFKGPDHLCADMVTGKLYPADRYFDVPRENRLFFDKKDKKIASKKYEPI